jgi:hypothetical protein
MWAKKLKDGCVGFNLIKFFCNTFFRLSVSLYVFLSPASICPSQSLLKGCFLLAAFNLKGGEKPGSALTSLPPPPPIPSHSASQTSAVRPKKSCLEPKIYY